MIREIHRNLSCQFKLERTVIARVSHCVGDGGETVHRFVLTF